MTREANEREGEREREREPGIKVECLVIFILLPSWAGF